MVLFEYDFKGKEMDDAEFYELAEKTKIFPKGNIPKAIVKATAIAEEIEARFILEEKDSEMIIAIKKKY